MVCGKNTPLSGVQYAMDHFWIVSVFQLMDAGFNLVKGLVAVNMEGELVDDGTCIHTLIHEMDGDAEHFHAVAVGVIDAMRPGERGEQGRVQVDDAVGEMRKQHFADKAHVSGQYDVVHRSFL